MHFDFPQNIGTTTQCLLKQTEFCDTSDFYVFQLCISIFVTQGDLPLGLQEVSCLQFLSRYSSLHGQGKLLWYQLRRKKKLWHVNHEHNLTILLQNSQIRAEDMRNVGT